MRMSTAVLCDTSVRLSGLRFPARRIHVQRTRLMFVHLDNLLHFAKEDRDGRVDGYIAVYLPDEVALLFLRGGDPISAVALTDKGREVLPFATALSRIRDDTQRSELAFCEAPPAQLAWMYASCATPIRQMPIPSNEPRQLLEAIDRECYTGLLEIISEGRVSYLRYLDGRLQDGFVYGSEEGVPLADAVNSLFEPERGGEVPTLAAAKYAVMEAVPEQASLAMLRTYRELFWRIVEAAEQEVEGEVTRRAIRLRDSTGGDHELLAILGADRAEEPEPVVAAPKEVTDALAGWTAKLLEELEVIAPGVAPGILREAAREHRYVLQTAGFFDRLPWAVRW